jgi:hypothetical protein
MRSPDVTHADELRKIVKKDGLAEDLETASGAIAGAAAGAIGGPIGAVIGAGLGTAAAVLAHEAVRTEKTLRAEHDRELDEDPEPGFMEPPTMAAWLKGDHDALDVLTSRALAIVEEGDSDEVRALIADVEAKLVEHMEGEERELIPRYAEGHPEEAAALLAEHANFRRLLNELGMAGDLHLVRLERVRELAEALKTHAKREDAGLYLTKR